ncbi:hypothetical protein AMTRI_Chr13g125830 [Amborella trichopoda]
MEITIFYRCILFLLVLACHGDARVLVEHGKYEAASTMSQISNDFASKESNLAKDQNVSQLKSSKDFDLSTKDVDLEYKFRQTDPQSHDSKHQGPTHIVGYVPVFLHESDLRLGNKLNSYYLGVNISQTPSPLPRQEADSIPFSSKSVADLLHHFSINPNSPQAKQAKKTLQICEEPLAKGEHRVCATSLESMHDFVSSIFGPKANLQVVATTIHNREIHSPVVQSYTVKGIIFRSTTPSLVACHALPYPYTLYYCHEVIKAKVFKVMLKGEDGNKVDAAVVCHLDTSHWDPNDEAFKVLKNKSGEPVCHLLPENNLVWLSTPV